jgi:hypothetical protein
MVTKETLLQQLPAYKDQWILINPSQSVDDIIHEVLEAHDEFAPLYDNIAFYFDGDNIEDTANKLYKFCKSNLKYNEEPESFQSTSVPQGILFRGECDCKGYSNFIGGCLDGLNRLGKNISWNYRFASYDLLDRSPHHVFIVVRDGNKEFPIDPTPGADKVSPVWKVDKKISALVKRKKIGGGINESILGKASITVTPVFNSDLLNWDGAGTIASSMFPLLSLSCYRDWCGDRNINEDAVADQINQIVASQGLPQRVDGQFVKWIYDESIRSWNFLAPFGTPIGYSADSVLPPNYPRFIITPDGRLNFDRDIPGGIDDYRNPYIHLLVAWAQSLINQYDPSPYPVKPEAIKRFSQGYEGGPDTRNLFTEARGDSIFTEIGNWLHDAVQVVADGIVKITGTIPRNAFLALVGLNIFHMADHLQQSINDGEWDAIKRKWEDLGGNPDKLFNTIQKGTKLPGIEDPNQTVDATIGEPMTVAAIITAAAPIIAAMLTFLNKDGKLTPVIQSVQRGLQTAFPDINWSFLGGQLMANGQAVNWQVDDRYNENSPTYQSDPPVIAWIKNNAIAAAGIGAIGTALITKKPGQKINFTLPLIVGAGIYFFASAKKDQQQLPGGGPISTTPLTTAQKKAALINWAGGSPNQLDADKNLMINRFNAMTDADLNITYTYIFDYLIKNKDVPSGSQLESDIISINDRFDIFSFINNY